MPTPRSANPFSLGLDADERRAAVQQAEEERARLRHLRIEAQSSPFSTPQERIRLWEELHSLSLPRDRGHRLVRVIASQTALTLQDIHDEQARRASAETQP
jgi:hypothetical protein